MTTYGCLLLFFGIKNTVYDYMTEIDAKWRISIIVFVFSFVFPAVNIYFMYRLKRIPNILLSDKRDRTFPYLMSSLFYFGLFYLLLDINIWPSVKLFIVGGGITILLTAIINLKFKISAHMIGIGGLLGVIISISHLIKFDMTVFYMLLILIAGIIGVSRLILKEHKPYQLYLGFLLGLAVQSGLFFVMKELTFA
jgi:hypothetical protein